MLAPGEPAPEFTLPDLEGGVQTLSSLVNPSGVLLVFFKVSCPTCQLTLPFLDRLHRGSTTTARIFLVSQDDEAATQAFHTHFGISIPTVLDAAEADYPVSNAFRIRHVPSLFWIGPGSRIDWASHGFHRHEVENLAQRFGTRAFRQDEPVPDWRAG